MTFSVVTVYWGNNENLESFIDDTLEYTDDIVIAYIDLLDKGFTSDRATVINLPHNFLLDYGYARAYNLARSYAKYKWTYSIGVSERITFFNEDIKDKLATSEYSAYQVNSEDLDGTWFRFGEINKSVVAGRIHEELCSIKMMAKTFKRSNEIISTWKKVPYIHNNKFEEDVCNGYRLMSRVKWLAGFDQKVNQHGPADFWWKYYDNSLAKSLFEQVEYIYDLPKNEMITELSKRSDWRDYPV
jgi:hypothetical protein